MNLVRQDFQSKVEEVRNYFLVLELVEDEQLKLVESAQGSAASVKKDLWLKTLKASFYLVLYNLTESTARQAVQYIYDELATQHVEYDTCRSEIRKIALDSLQKRNAEKALEGIMQIARDVIKDAFTLDLRFGGNLDAREFRRVATKFGLDPIPKGIGWKMQAVKDYRNDLAHGTKSFEEVGRDAALSDMNEALKQSVELLELFLDSVESYMQNQRYLESNKAV